MSLTVHRFNVVSPNRILATVVFFLFQMLSHYFDLYSFGLPLFLFLEVFCFNDISL